AIALSLAVLPRTRTQIAQHRLAFADLEFGDLAELRGIALAGAAGEIVEDTAARAVDRIGAARFHQAQIVERLMRQERSAGGFGRPARQANDGQRSEQGAERSIHDGPLTIEEIRDITDRAIVPQLRRLHGKVRISTATPKIPVLRAVLACTGAIRERSKLGKKTHQNRTNRRGPNMAGTD